MKKSKYDWSTEHIEGNNVMKHIFPSGRIEVFSNKQSGLIYIHKDGHEIDCLNGKVMMLDDYTEMMVQLSKEDKKLEGFRYER